MSEPPTAEPEHESRTVVAISGLASPVQRHRAARWIDDPFRVRFAAIIAFGGFWLWRSLSDGWYWQEDISNLADGLHAKSPWAYLTQPVGGHFAPVGRAIYWILDELGPLDWGTTVAVRVAIQVVSIWLLGTICVRLAGPSPVVLVGLLWFTISPLLLPGLAMLTTSMGIGLGQLLGLLAIRKALDFADSPTLRRAFSMGLLVGLGALVSEVFGVYVLLVPIIVIGLCWSGGYADRARRARGLWLKWLAFSIPILLVSTLSVTSVDHTQIVGMTPSQGYHLVVKAWFHAVGPAAIGGPYSWYSPPGQYIGYYDPRPLTIIVGQAVLLVVLAYGWYRNSHRAAVAWALPIGSLAGGMLLAGAARYHVIGELIAITPRYSAVVAVPLVLAMVVSLAPPPESHNAAGADKRPLRASAGSMTDVIGRAGARVGSGSSGIAIGGVRGREVLTLAFILAVGGAVVTSVEFDRVWRRNPTHAYVQNLAASIRRDGSTRLYNSTLPSDIVYALEPRHRVEDLLDLLHSSATYTNTEAAPQIIDGNGRVADAVFLPAAHAKDALAPCGTRIAGAGTFVVPLDTVPALNEWFVQLELFQQFESVVDIDALDGAGNVMTPLNGTRFKLGKLAVATLALPIGQPASVRIRTAGAPISTCFVKITVGAPFPKNR